MPQTLPSPARNGKSLPEKVGPIRGAAVRAMRTLLGSKNDEAAHQHTKRIVTDFFRYVQTLRANERTETIVGYQARLLAELDQGSIPTMRTAIRLVGLADRSEDDTREHAILSGLAPESLDRLDRRTRVEIAEKLNLLVAIRRRKAVAL